MSRNQRIGLVVAALVVAVVAFLIARPGDDDDNGSERAAQTAPAQTETGAADKSAETQTETEAPEPEISRIRVRGGTVVGGVQRVQANKGDTVRIVVTSDAPDEIHLHGYDIYEDTAPGKPARFVFRADIEGIFEIESHEAEEAGRDPLLARLVVEPS
jgi:FtsP/CotA-like multicopper oxidase with cupredoxin domain